MAMGERWGAGGAIACGHIINLLDNNALAINCTDIKIGGCLIPAPSLNEEITIACSLTTRDSRARHCTAVLLILYCYTQE